MESHDEVVKSFPMNRSCLGQVCRLPYSPPKASYVCTAKVEKVDTCRVRVHTPEVCSRHGISLVFHFPGGRFWAMQSTAQAEISAGLIWAAPLIRNRLREKSWWREEVQFRLGGIDCMTD